MKFLFMSRDGDGLGLALRLKENGHKVAVWIMHRRSKENYEGLITKVERWDAFLDKDTIVVYDTVGGGKTADRLRARGHYVFAGSTFADTLEQDRGTAFAFLEKVGVRCPEWQTFYDWEDGKRFAKRFKGRLVFKPSGKLGEQAEVITYVSADADDLVAMMEYFETRSNVPPEFELQEFIEGGVAVSTEGWFNGETFLRPFNHTIERKQIMNDNLGPSGGCAGNAVWQIDRHNHIVENGILKLEPVLRENAYVGPIDLNTVVTAKDVFALELTPRFGYDALPAFLEMFEGDVGELIGEMARGEKPEEMVLKAGFGVALRISIPPYPSDEFKPAPGIPIRGFERGDRPHLYFYDVQLNEENKLVTSSGFGSVVAVTGISESIVEGFSGVEALARKAKIPEKQFRTDLGKVLTEDYGKWLGLVQMQHEQPHKEG